MVGSKIVRQLVQYGYRVRVLSRKPAWHNANLEVFQGDILDKVVLSEFLKDSQILFHCAAELNDQASMWEVNVEGTRLLLNLAAQTNVHFCCVISSAGVVGLTDRRWVNEEAPCNPRNAYEKSKWAAEQLAAQGIDGARMVILRPTNVIDDNRPGALALPQRGSWTDRLQVLLKGGECAHLIHAEDVAAAAIFFINRALTGAPQVYFVSCDHEPYNTFAGLWSLYRACQAQRPVDNLKTARHLPLMVPNALRRIRQGPGNKGDVRYSSEKLLSTGFRFPLGVKGAVQRVIKAHRNK